jgi:hypothetical protein
MSLSATPTHRALPIAPWVSWPPVTRGANRPRLLPEHWLTATISRGLNFERRSATESSSVFPAPLPPTRMTWLSPSMVLGMPALWYRTKKASLGVITPSLKTSNGVSSCGGREVSTMSGRFSG